MTYPYKKGIIYNSRGEIKEAHLTPENNPAEFPPTATMEDGDESAMVFDDEKEFPITDDPDDHRPFHKTIHYECRVQGGKLLRNEQPMKALLVPHARRRAGVIERNTVKGWKSDDDLGKTPRIIPDE